MELTNERKYFVITTNNFYSQHSRKIRFNIEHRSGFAGLMVLLDARIKRIKNSCRVLYLMRSFVVGTVKCRFSDFIKLRSYVTCCAKSCEREAGFRRNENGYCQPGCDSCLHILLQ